MITRATLDAHGRRAAAELTPEQALDACAAFGPYAPWWLDGAVRAKAAAYDDGLPLLTGTPDRPIGPGGCNILLARGAGHAALAPGFVLPVRWRRDAGHGPLPRALLDVADRVCGQFGERGWRLWPAVCDRGRPCGLAADLPLSFESAWVALAGGLVLARNEWTARPEVFATGCWDDEAGAVPVGPDGLLPKVEAAARHGGTTIVVAPGQVRAARDAAGAGLAVVALSPGTDPRTALRPYLAALGEPPQVDPSAADDDPQFRRGVGWYNLLPFRSPAHRDYYFDQLLPVIRNSVRARAGAALGGARPVALAAVVSNGWEVIPLLAAAFGVVRVMLLHTPDYEKHLTPLRSRLIGCGVPGAGIRPAPFRLGTMRADLLDRLSTFGAGGDPAALLTDVTLGTVPMSLALTQIARRRFPESWLVYLTHQQTSEGRPHPGTECPLVWRAGDEMPELPEPRTP